MNDHDRALAALDQDGFAQGTNVDPYTGGRCVLSLYEKFLYSEEEGSVERLRRHRTVASEFTQAAGIKVDVDSKDSIGNQLQNYWSAMIAWNDADGRTAADLREAFKKASEAHELGG